MRATRPIAIAVALFAVAPFADLALADLALAPLTLATQDAPPPERRQRRQRPPQPAPDPAVAAFAESVTEAIATGGVRILDMQEDFDSSGEAAEWPYEGVYRVRGQIPIGYRVGGTGISGLALLAIPDFDDDRLDGALSRATAFICGSIEHPLMSPDYDGGYDTRGWGHCYGLKFLLRLRALERVPDGMDERVDDTVRWFVDALQLTELPQVGGWNYARSPGRDAVSPAAPFMTAPCLLALYEARQQGFAVDDAVVERALVALERCRTSSGSYAYSAAQDASRRTDGTPGAVGRMLSAETALLLGGRGSIPQVRASLDAFLAHWQRLEERRQQTGTHVPPFGVAPYYFMFAHQQAGRAIELLPPHERPEYRRRLAELLMQVRDDDETWNDRVFPRSRAYSTAMAILALHAPNMPAPPRWEPTTDE